MQALDGGLSLGVGVHLHEAEALAAARVAIFDDLGALHRAELGEEFFEVRAGDLIREIPNIKLLAHRLTPGGGHDPAIALRV